MATFRDVEQQIAARIHTGPRHQLREHARQVHALALAAR